MAAGAFVLFLTKRTKSQVTSLCFFAHRALRYKAGQHHGLFRFAPMASPALGPSLHANLKGPSLRTGPRTLPRFWSKLEDDENPSLTLPFGEGIERTSTAKAALRSNATVQRSVGLPAHPTGCMAL
jgi:hypothetical protein